jgi:hypothetical protein
MLQAAAANIMNAVLLGSLPKLEEELDRAALLCDSQASVSSYEAERMELLDAVACHMKNSLGRMRRLSSGPLDGAEASLRLLEHLAHPRS